MWTVEFLILVAATFLAAGFVKGVIGLGLPTVSLAILTATIGLRDAMALMLIPSLLTNIWQMFAGPHLRHICRRFWPMTLASIVGTFAGLRLGVTVDVEWLAALLGGVLILYATFGLSTPRLPAASSDREHVTGTAMGFGSGVMTGLVGVFLVPTVLYLQALRLDKAVFVQTLGLLFSVATVTLGIALSRHELLTGNQLSVSALAILPAFLGMYIGQHVRRRLTEDRFRSVVFMALGAMGLYLIFRTIA